MLFRKGSYDGRFAALRRSPLLRPCFKDEPRFLQIFIDGVIRVEGEKKLLTGNA